jgi:hypothetical protein
MDNLEPQTQGKLQLARGVGASSFHEVGLYLVVGWEVVDSNLLSAVVELMLPIGRLDVQKRIAGVKGAVALVIESGAVKFVRRRYPRAESF